MCLLTFYPLWHFTQKASRSVIPAPKAELISGSVGRGVVEKDHTQRALFQDFLPNTPEDRLHFSNTPDYICFIRFSIFLFQTHLAPPFSSAAVHVCSCFPSFTLTLTSMGLFSREKNEMRRAALVFSRLVRRIVLKCDDSKNLSNWAGKNTELLYINFS